MMTAISVALTCQMIDPLLAPGSICAQRLSIARTPNASVTTWV